MIATARVRRAGSAVLLALSVLSMCMSSGAAEPEEQVVTPGERIVVNANGFVSGATVTLRLIPTLTSQSATANPGGHVQFLYLVPKTLINGEYRLAIVGPGRDVPRGALAPGGNVTPTLTIDPVEVSVPLVLFHRFRIGGLGVASVPPTSRHKGPLSETGVPVEQHLAIGFGSIVAGAIVLLLGVRRRRRRRA